MYLYWQWQVIPFSRGSAWEQPPPDLASYLYKNRIVYLGMSLVPSVTELILAEFLYLQYEDEEKPIYLYINSTGTTKVSSFVLPTFMLYGFMLIGLCKWCLSLSRLLQNFFFAQIVNILTFDTSQVNYYYQWSKSSLPFTTCAKTEGGSIFYRRLLTSCTVPPKMSLVFIVRLNCILSR